MMQGLYCRLSD